MLIKEEDADNVTLGDSFTEESVPLKESIEEYFKREVLPHLPDVWIDESKTKVGYEIRSTAILPVRTAAPTGGD